MKKRVLSLVLCLSLLLSLLPTAAFAVKSNLPFTDVESSDWYYSAVQYVYENGMMSGTGDTTFSPDTTTTRGMIVTILHRMEGKPTAAGETFTDVAAGQYYADAVAWASANGIVSGYGNNLFGPNDPITREQMAAILYRYVQYKGYDDAVKGDVSAFADGNQVSSYAVEAMKWAVGVGLISGVGNNMLDPTGSATRAQVATILMRFCENIASSGQPEVTYTVNFDYNYSDKGIYQSVTVKAGNRVDKPSNPKRSGYSFKGWYTKSAGGSKFDFDTEITKDITLYAQWSKNSSGGSGGGTSTPPVESYTVTFESNGGSAVASQTVKKGMTVTEPEAPTKEGSTFVGWYADAALENEYNFSSAVISDITVYAKWAENTVPEEPSAPDDSDPDLSLGTDIDAPSTEFEKEDATPTFSSREDEIANIAALNGGTTPYLQTDDNGVPSYIDGAFSDRSVHSAADAIESLNDIHHIMGFENAEQEFEEVYTETVDFGEPTNFYRLQQTYHGIPVYGYQLVISSADDGAIKSLSGHYLPDIVVNDTPQVTMDDAKEIALHDFGKEVVIVSNGLFIYCDDQESVVLVWIIRSINHVWVISAIDGHIISGWDLLDDTLTGTGVNSNGDNVTFPIVQKSDAYFLSDELRNIETYDYALGSGVKTLIQESSNETVSWSRHPEALSAYYNTIEVLDYYSSILGRDGSDNKHKKIKLGVRLCVDSAHNSCVNAVCAEYLNYTELNVYHMGGLEKGMDVIGHEFTHAVCRNTWLGLNTNSENARGAINEGYADILGDLIEEGRVHLIGNYTDYGTLRDASSPEVNSMSEAENNFCTQPGDHRDHGCDKGNVHNNSTLITSVAYKMDQNWPTENHGKELATLFYYSMQYLTPNSSFMDCRYALLAASKSMKMSDAKRNVIATAFADVGIVPEDEEAWASMHHIIGVVKDATTQSPVIDAQVIAVATEGWGGGVGYTDGNGNYDVKVNRAVYTVSVYAPGYRMYRIENVDLSQLFILNHYMDTIYLTPLSLGDDTQNVFASGKITNALSGQALEGVTVKFRNGSNNQSGSYVQTVVGLDIELTTDSSGQYYTAALPAGNYTLEASKAGYITGYTNIISGNSEICSSQNVSLTPELQPGALRIVLEWGQNPHDMDSHVVGTLSNGTAFYVYFSHKSQFDDGTEVCNLDVDDVSSYGPETITLIPTTSTPYYYYIKKFSGTGTTATSEARVTVYQGNNVLATFYVPTNQGDGDFWNVFAVVDGEIVVRNTVTASAETSYAGSRDSRSTVSAMKMLLDNDMDEVKDYEK